MSRHRNNFIKSHKKLVVLVSILGVFLLIILGTLIYGRIIISEMRSVANSFPTENSWIKKYDIAHAPGVCIDIECPSYSKGWELPAPLTEAELNSLVARGAERASVKTNVCTINASGNLSICEKEYSQKGYHVVIRYDSKTVATPQELSIEIKR